MIFKANSAGSITVDEGLENALDERKLSILPKGVLNVSGEFLSSSVVDILNKDGIIIAKGITNYSSQEISSIIGLSSVEAKDKIGFDSKKGIVYATNLVILKEGYYGRFVK